MKFGTDGIRGPAGRWPIDVAGARAVGRAVAAWVGAEPVVVGWDTRASSEELARAVADGLVRGGADAWLAGVVPTGAVACAVAASDAFAGIVVTASHNAAADNGFKVLDAAGRKLHDTEELEEHLGATHSDVATPGAIVVMDDPAAAWRAALARPDLGGRRILFDGAHGASAVLGASFLEELGARVVRRGCAPDGTNINAGVGSLHPPTELGDAELAIVLDGDGDRCVLVTDEGVLDGDDLLAMLAQAHEGPVVGTILSNGGLEGLLGARFHRAPVGDREVQAQMDDLDAAVGGEPSGHVVFRDGPPCADGLATALAVIDAAGMPPRRVPWSRVPQVMRSAPRLDSLDLEALAPLLDDARGQGHRVVVRPSGTEAVVRVMVEGPQADLWAGRLVAALRGATP